MKDIISIKKDLQLYLFTLEEKNKGVSNTYFKAFYNGEIKGIKTALDFINGNLYYKDKNLLNKER